MTERERLAALGRQVAAELDVYGGRRQLTGARRAFLNHVEDAVVVRERRRLASPWRSRIRPPLVLGLAAVAVLALGVGVHSLSVERPLAFTVAGAHEDARVGEWLAAPPDEALALRFSDGSWFELSPSSRGRVLEVDAHGSHVMLERGAASVQVSKRPEARWRFSAGPFAVDVLGTRFDLAWDPERDEFLLRLIEGRVNVSGCSFREGRPVLPGELVRASCAGRRFEVVSTDAEMGEASPGEDAQEVDQEQLEPALEPTDAAPEPTRARVSGGARGKAPDWRDAAREGRYAEALTLAETGGFDTTLESASVADLQLLADAARLAGRLERAVSAYKALRQRFGGTMAASTAAFHLARIHFDQKGSYARAAAWFEIYLSERPRGGLAREATGRWLEALRRSGNRTRARDVAERYLRDYPQGPHAALARSVLGNDAAGE